MNWLTWDNVNNLWQQVYPNLVADGLWGLPVWIRVHFHIKASRLFHARVLAHNEAVAEAVATRPEVPPVEVVVNK